MRSRLTVEYASRGATYRHADGYTVYEHSTYPRSSVLAGQPRRVFVETFATLAEAQAAFPAAEFLGHDGGSTYAPPDLSHLPDDGDD
jgi:hypothetical protein